MLLKALALVIIGKVRKMSLNQNLLFALLLSQAGEFVFVLLGAIRHLKLIDASHTDMFMAIVTMSMIVSPVLLFLYDKFLAGRLVNESVKNQNYHVETEDEHPVIIAGFSHFGSTVGRFLRANNVNATILDNDSDRVILLRKMGFNVHFGDAARLDLLEAAGIAKAKIFISAIDSQEKTMEIAELIRKHYPNVKMFLRVKNRFNAYDFMEKDHKNIYRESLHTSINMGVDVLTTLGQRRYTASRKALDFIKYDQRAMENLLKNRSNLDDYILSVREEIAEQERLLQEDSVFIENQSDNAWDNTPLKG
jgi:CPA2 family monovalent cation:H+ antiporter-2